MQVFDDCLAAIQERPPKSAVIIWSDGDKITIHQEVTNLWELSYFIKVLDRHLTKMMDDQTRKLQVVK